MKKTILLFSILISQLVFANEKNCNVLLATGPNFFRGGQINLPKDYSKKLARELENKGYNVVGQLQIGNFTWDEKVNNEAVKQKSKVFEFRPALNSIANDLNIHERECNMGIEIRNPETGVIEIHKNLESVWSTVLPAAFLCHTSFKAMIDLIPDCE